MPATNGKLTPKQSRFVDEYLIDLNATQAAIRAGYSENCASETGYENLRKPQIQVEIQRALNRRAEQCEITAERVLMELARIAFSNMADYVTAQDDGTAFVDLSQLTPDQAAAIQEIQTDEYMEGRGEDAVAVRKIKFKLHQRTRALELLGKHLGMFDDRLQIAAVPGFDVNFRLVEPKEDG